MKNEAFLNWMDSELSCMKTPENIHNRIYKVMHNEGIDFHILEKMDDNDIAALRGIGERSAPYIIRLRDFAVKMKKKREANGDDNPIIISGSFLVHEITYGAPNDEVEVTFVNVWGKNELIKIRLCVNEVDILLNYLKAIRKENS